MRSPAEIERETQLIQTRYASPSPRLFPAAVSFLVPEREAHEGLNSSANFGKIWLHFLSPAIHKPYNLNSTFLSCPSPAIMPNGFRSLKSPARFFPCPSCSMRFPKGWTMQSRNCAHKFGSPAKNGARTPLNARYIRRGCATCARKVWAGQKVYGAKVKKCRRVWNFSPQYGETLRPDGALIDPQTQLPRLLWMQLEAGQKPTALSKDSGWNASPQTRLTELLRATRVPLGLLSNGESWVLIYAPHGETASYINWNATLWGEEALTWRAFVSLLDAQRFFSVDDDNTLVRLFERSVDFQHEVTDQLGRQVRRALELLVATWEREDQNHGGALFAGLGTREIYRAALSVMMRLVFLLCAEERDLLPLENEFYANSYAVSPLRAELREQADIHTDEWLERRFDAWPRLLATFRAIYGGIAHDRCPLIPYGGSLFDPDQFPFLEGRAAGTSWRETPAAPLPVDNRTVLYLLEALQLLEVRMPGGGEAQSRVVSFRALDIEQIGHVYEGLLDHTVRRADGIVLSLKGAGGEEPEIALQALEELADDPKPCASTCRAANRTLPKPRLKTI